MANKYTSFLLIQFSYKVYTHIYPQTVDNFYPKGLNMKIMRKIMITHRIPQDLGITRKFVDKYIFCGIIYLLLYQNTDKGTSYPQQIAVKINGLGQFYIDI